MFPTYECVLVQWIEATDGFAIGRRPCRLPFSPCPGMKISGHLRDKDMFATDPDTVEEVVYHAQTGEIELVLDLDSATEYRATMEEAKALYDDQWTWADVSARGAERNGRG